MKREETHFGGRLMAHAERHPLVTIAIFTLLTLGLFINKAVHMDDPLFVWTAEWILKHPLDCYGFGVNWYGGTGLMATINCNPPTTSYFLAGVASVFGWQETVLHTAFMLVAFAAGAGIYQLAKMWCERPLPATIVAMITPLFLVSSTTLMCDVPMLALWIWAVVMWERALKNGGARYFLSAGILAGLAVLTKYSALTFLPLLPVMGALRKRRPGWWLLWLAVPAAMIETYQLVTAKLYGQGLISMAMDYAAANRFVFEGGGEAKWMIGLAFTGGCLLPAIFFAPWLWSRRALLAGGTLVFGLSLGVLSFSGKLGPMDLTNGVNSHWAFLLQMSLLMAGGLHLLLLTAVESWRRRDTVTIVLAVWIFSGFLFATVLNWTVSARSLLPVVPAVAILLIRRLGRKSPIPMERNRWLWPAIPSAIIGLCVTAADFDLANSARTAAGQIMAQYQPAAGRLWFEGHWGFQYYMEKLGAQPVDLELTTLQPGDILIVPLNNSNITLPAPDDAEMLGTAEFEACSWLSLMRTDMGAGFYDADYGPLPFCIGPVTPERYRRFKVLRPMQFQPSSAGSADPQAIQAEYESALRANPKNAQAHAQLAFLLQKQGQLEEAVGHYRETLRLMPTQPGVLNNFAWLLATCPDAHIRNGTEAVQLAERACKLTRDQQTVMLGTLAAAYAEAGRFDDAIVTAQKACALASASDQPELLKFNQQLLESYRRHQPYHEAAKP